MVFKKKVKKKKKKKKKKILFLIGKNRHWEEVAIFDLEWGLNSAPREGEKMPWCGKIILNVNVHFMQQNVNKTRNTRNYGKVR